MKFFMDCSFCRITSIIFLLSSIINKNFEKINKNIFYCDVNCSIFYVLELSFQLKLIKLQKFSECVWLFGSMKCQIVHIVNLTANDFELAFISLRKIVNHIKLPKINFRFTINFISSATESVQLI